MKRPVLHRSLPVAGALLGVVVLTAGCAGTPRASEDIGVRRVGLSLAFKDEALAKPVEPKVLIQYLPAPPSLASQPEPNLEPFIDPPTSTPRTPTRPPEPPACTKGEDPGPDAPAPLSIVKPPKAGVYQRKNTGTIKVSNGALTFTLPYPAITKMEVTNVKAGTLPGPLGVGTTPGTGFDVIETLTPTSTITESYFLTATELDLVSRTTKNESGSVSVKPVPALKVYDFAGLGTTWVSVGVDLPQHRATALQGKVSRSLVVDVCGSLIDTIETATSITTTDLLNPSETSGTQTGATDRTAIATQLGGLFARREFHTTEIVSANGAPATITYDVVSTLVVPKAK